MHVTKTQLEIVYDFFLFLKSKLRLEFLNAVKIEATASERHL